MTSGPSVEVLRRHGRSFHWASRLLPGDQAAALADLYAVCRAIDDLADESPDRVAAACALDRLADALQRGAPDDPLSAQALALQATHDMDPSALLALIAGVRQDLVPVAIPSEAALRRYAYAVAGTVGLMVCAVLNVRTPGVQPHAVDLGLAMQMTNIARDIAADAAMDRVYLPAPWIEGATAADIRACQTDPAHPLRPVLSRAVLRLLSLADAHYASARRGLAGLPWQARLGIRTAALVYRGIGTRLRWRGGDALGGRVHTSSAAKVGLTARALGLHLADGLTMPRTPKHHDPALHGGLAGLPGANVA